MKAQKIILPGFVIAAFIAYSVALRHDATPTTVAKNTTSTTSSTGSTNTSTQSSTSSSSTTSSSATYKNGTYTGDAADAFYGNIQVAVTIKDSKITDVQFLQYPNDRGESVEINQQAMPLLKQEAIKAQNAQVDGVSGATDTSQAFIQSLSSALTKAQA